ncbi:hypothetical protein TRFO_18341 [Tritrichomonas foetus]|uniref:Uncharacterized protein n=1 Tax=Tritrichomonas foetus TaxID=1144522 RepID=A0A1J4KQ97_9EUKA|nr:hypothetical protein TRFO_18341 [Tritrichomonas foetus]|eukprot:OHT11964.1 hypothetical protein TRFO_18341 [Tritrichomonas foetus]
MQNFVARKRKIGGLNIKKDLFIYGIYPVCPLHFFQESSESIFNPNDLSFFPQIEHKPWVLAHTNTDPKQFLIFSQIKENQKSFFWVENEHEMFRKLIENYLTDLIQVKPSKTCKIHNIGLSSFSQNNDQLVLNGNQFRIALSILKQMQIESQNPKKIHIIICDKEMHFQDCCLIPALISFLSRNSDMNGPFIVVCSTFEAIEILFKDFKNWSKLRVLVMHGENDDIEILQKFVFPSVKWNLSHNNIQDFKYHVVLTTIQTFTQSQGKFFSRVKWNIAFFLGQNKEFGKRSQNSPHFIVSFLNFHSCEKI